LFSDFEKTNMPFVFVSAFFKPFSVYKTKLLCSDHPLTVVEGSVT
jgi:hypothetical protein